MKRTLCCIAILIGLAFSSCSPRHALDATDHSHSDADLEVTRQIRQTLLSPNDLSLSAKNVTIVTRSGAVTLLGVVTSEDERRELVAIASSLAGRGRVSEDLEVWPD
jgi:osmotically-inducible protein OsmY